MSSRLFRERIAISLLAAAVVLGAMLGAATIRAFSQPASAAFAGQAQGGQVSPTDSGANPADASSGPGQSSQATGSSGGVSGGTVTIGGFFDITGPIDSSVERDTVRSYMQAVNQSGGINGRKVQYVWCDSKYDATAAHQCAQYLVAQHVLAVVGLTAPLGEDNEIHFLTGQGIPVIGGLGTPNEYNDPLAFPVSANFYRYGSAIADEAKALGVHHPAVVVLSDVPWVHPVEANLLNRLKADGIGYTDVEEVSATQPSYTATVFNLRHMHHGPSSGGAAPNYQCPLTSATCPDYVIAALDPFSYHRLFDAMEASNWYPGVLGAGLDKFNVQKSYDGELRNAHSLVPFLSPYDHQGNATVKQYLGTVYHFYPGQFQSLDIYTQHAWTAAMVFVEAARKAGANLTRESLIQALDGLQGFQTGWSVPLSYGSGPHDPNHCFTYTADTGGGWHTTSSWVCS